MHTRKKITIVGSGNVGSQAAFWAAAKELGDIALIDILEGIPQGKALDIYESTPLLGSDCKITGTNDYEDTKDSDIVIITAGIARKPGMTREDLLAINKKIVSEVTEKIVKYSPNCILIIISNPLDAMVYVAHKVSGFPKSRIMGMAGVLDTARYRSFVAEALDVSVKDVNAFVLGSHGDTMIPMSGYANINGVPLNDLLSASKIKEIEQRTRDGGAEIVNLLKTGSAFFAPGVAAIEMAESIIKDKKRVLPVCAYLDGEYGIKGIFMGVMAELGKNGVEKIIEFKLNKEQQMQFNKTAEHIKSLVSGL